MNELSTAAPAPQGLIDSAAAPQSPPRPVEPLPEANSLLAEPQQAGEGLIGSQPAELSEDEVQQAYEMAVTMMSKVLYRKGGTDRLLAIMKSPGGTIQDKIVDTVKNMVVELDERADLPEEVIVPAALEIMGEVVEICVKARLMKEDQKSVEALGSMLTAVLFDEYGVTEEQVNAVRGEPGEQGAGEADQPVPDDDPAEEQQQPAAGPKPLIASEMSA